jgi:dihydroxyacid dehydratase/phosphogluconate dehydratase
MMMAMVRLNVPSIFIYGGSILPGSQLDRIGDDLARGQRGAHAAMAHRDAVGDRDGADAMGLTREQIHQPLVGVASCWNEAAPCNISLMRQAL